MKPLLLSFDVEEFDWPAELGRRIDFAQQIEVSEAGLRRILSWLERGARPATFFVTGVFARARPACVRELSRAGHEVAVHGLAHADDYGTMPPEVACARLREARHIIESTTGVPVTGVRTPRLRPCPAAVLRQAGFAYDASPHPTWVPGRYNGLPLERRPWWEAGLLRIPISVMPAVRWPVSWLWYRLAGARLGTAAARAAALRAPYLHLYFHSWEAVPLRPYGIPAPLAARTGPGLLDLLDSLVARPFEVMTVAAYAHRCEIDRRCGPA